MEYKVFSHKVIIEGESIDTFGIVAIDQKGEKHIFEDVTTFYDKIEKFVAFLNDEKPTIKCFRFLLDDFMDNL